ncbi:hypothetical protein LTR99_008377 [Exophiala xenobiotica]|uniref:Chitin-binding type-2 domain-containing protein n=1 Tax=Vermiconidia calcicola TaxID=1690605 RepID=A0AAV9Q079_9PEZI|nr:hypothetical protein LTR92_008474 [Exophiala xenobiotica]KAK5531149.1 hypothetical protein LTR23_010063 [Chaetothyriales sp. CCFEE 6169]KAK5532767.1 hypothetical protein LTR25_007471 [Vermiconidia calcicola]KAK5218535.1 hypothetical protein LTR72_008474 [Exophiala xenobiotica]KAK5270156.1 hypothetical protein LTR96_004656 [Exophiala xenobiotica]
MVAMSITGIMNFSFFTIILMLASISFMTTSVSAMPSNLTLADGCPSTQPIDQAGCSTCTECCLFQFNTAGCGKPSVWTIADPPSTKCMPLTIGMYAAWISECTGWYDTCFLWKNVDCTGDGSIWIDNSLSCYKPGYVIKSISCAGS